MVSAMISMRHVLRSLPLLAGVLGDTYGVAVVIGHGAAHTDGKTIHLPSLPPNSDPSLLPLVRGLIDHEAAHIRETDFAALQAWRPTPFSRHIWNSLEDWRVENRLADLFPGCRQNFKWLIEHYFAGTQDRAGDIAPALSVLNAILLTVRSWDSPGVTMNRDQAIQNVEDSVPGIWPGIQDILDEARTASRSTEDTIRAAEEIVALIRGVCAGNDNSPMKIGDDPDESKVDEHQQEEHQPGGLADTGNPKTQMPSTSEVESEDERSLPLTQAQTKSLIETMDLEETPEEWPQHLGDLLAQSVDACSPGFSDNRVIVARRGHKPGRPFEASDLEACRRASVAMRARLFRLLQATRLTRCQIGRQGHLDTSRLQKVVLGESRVFRKYATTPGVNTAVHILLDSSGSMAGAKLKLASMACYTVAAALEKITGVNMAVSVFPAGTAHGGITVAPLIEHGQKTHANLDIQAEGYTPMAQALWWVLQHMQSLSETRKIIIILTDGDPDSIPAAKTALKVAQDLGYEVYGLGILSTEIAALLPETSAGIDRLEDLPSILHGLIGNILISHLRGK
jgi:cobalamin biosynthesis protein CobT